MASTFKFLDRKSSENETSANDRAQLIMQLAQQQMRQQRNNQRAFALLLEKAAPSQRTTGGTDGMGKDKKAVQEPVKAKRGQGQWDLDVIQEFVINDMQWGQPSKRQMKKMGRKVKAMDLSIEDLILPPVPANDSPETYAELLEIQEMAMLRDAREKDIAAQARKDGIIAEFKAYSDEHGLQTNWDFVRMVLDDIQTICLNLKFTYNRVRPSTLAQHLEVVLSPQGGFDKIDSPSYPSFHSTAGRVLAEVISGAYAGHREKLMRIGDTIGMNRVIGGYHFLTDHQAGQTLGSHLVLKIPQNLSINPVYETEQTVDGRTAEAVAANFMDALEQRHRTMAVNKEENAEDNYVEGIRAAMATHSRETSHMTDILKSKKYPHAFDEKGLEFLSNYEPVEVGGWEWNKDTKEWESDGETYPSVEHAYQASCLNNYGRDKALRRHIRNAEFAGVGGEDGEPLGARGLAQKHGVKKLMPIDKRDGSPNSPVLQLMEKLVTEKFNDPVLRKKLEETHATHEEIEEANTHGDEFWGTVGTGGKAGKGGRGSNHLGKILTKVRGGTPQTTSSPSKTTKQHMFVFGSNLDGRNGKGAALHAQKFGASKKGVRGADLDRVEGNTYSLPTKLRPSDLKFNPKDKMSLTEEMKHHFENFARYVLAHPEIEFHIPNLGMENGGYGSDQGKKSLAATFTNAFRDVFKASNANFQMEDLRGRLHFDKGVEKDGKVGTGLGDLAFRGIFKDTSATYDMPDSAKLPSSPEISPERRKIASTLGPTYRDPSNNKLKSGALDSISSAIPEDSDGNTFSASNDQFLAQLTHANVIANRKFKKDVWPKQGTDRELPVTYKGITYPDAEQAYHELIRSKGIEGTSKEAHDIMVGVNKAKFAAYTDLVTTLSDRGGLTYLKTLKHDVPTSSGEKKWEGEGVEALFLRVIAEAYADADGVTAENKKGLSDFREGKSVWGNYTTGDNGRSLTDKSQGTEPMYYAYDDKRPARNDALHSTGGTYNAILTGDRTSTTRQNWNYKEGAIVSIKYNNASTDSFDVRITSVDDTGGIDPEVWSKSEGYKPSEHSKYTGPRWKTYTFEPIEDERFKAEVDKFNESDQGDTYHSVTSEVSSDGNIYPDFEEARAGEDQGFDEAEQERARDTANGVTDFGDELEAARADEGAEESNINDRYANVDPREAFGDAEASSGIGSSDAYGGKYDDEGVDWGEDEDEEFVEGDRSVVMHSGLAEGADTMWDEARTDKTSQKLAGHSFEGHAWKYKGKDRVHHDSKVISGNRGKYKDAIGWLREHGSRSREIIPENKNTPDDIRQAEFNLNLQMRNYEQVRNSDAVIAVVKEFRNKAPVGGTGAAVAMGIQKGIPVHVFDENNERWVTYDAKQDDWFETLRPPFYKNFAAVGSRKIAEDSIGHDAIKDYMGALEEFQKGSETFGGEVERTTNIPVVPDHIKDYFDKKLEGTEDRSNMSEDEQRRSDMAATQQPPEWNASVDEDTLKSIRARKLSALRGVEKEVVEAKKLLDEARETLSNADEGDREEAVYEANIRRQKHDEAVQQRASAQREAEGALADIKAFRKQPRSPKPTKAEKTEAARQKKLDDNPMNSPEARKVQPRPEFEHNPILEISDNDGKPFESFGKGLGGGEDISEASDTYSTEGMAILLSILHGTASGGDSNVSDINYERPAMPDDKTLTGADLAVLYSEYGNEENKDKHFGVKEVLEDYFQYHIATDRLGKNNILSRITEWIGDWEEGNYLEFVDWIGENFSPEGEPAYRSNRGEAVSSGSEIHHMYGNDKVNFDQLESENSPAGKLKAQRKRMKSREDQREEADVEWLGLSVEQRLERSQQWLDDHRDVFASMLKSTTTSEDGTVTEIPGMSRGEKIFLKNVGMYTPQFENEEYTPKDNPLRDLNFALLKESLGWRNQNGLRKEFGFDMIPDPDQKEAMDLYRKTNGKEGAKYNPKLDKRKPGEKWHLELGDFMGVAKAVDLLVSNPTKYLNTDENYTNPAMMRKIEEIATHRDNMSPEEQDWWTSLCEKGADRRTDVFTGRRTEWFKELFLNPKGIPAAMGRIAFNFQDYRDKDNPFKGEKSPDEHWREALADVTEQRRRSQLRGTLERGTGYMDGDDARPNSFFGGEKSSRQNTDDVEALFVRALDDKFRGLDTFRALIGGQGFRDKVRLKLKAYRAAKEQLDTRASSSYGDPQAGEMYEKDYAALADMGNYDLRAAFHQLQHDASINTHVMSQDSSIAALDSIPSQYRLFAGADERQDYVRAYTAASYSGREAIRDAIATGGIVNAPEFIASVGEKFDPKFDSLYNEKAKGYAEVAGMVTGHIANNREYDDATDSVVNQDDLNDVNEEIDEIELDIKAATNEEQPYDEDKMTDLRADLRDARRRKKDIESNETALNDSGGSEQYDTLTLNRRAPTAEAQQAEVRTYHDIEAIMENLSSKKPYPTKGNREVNPYHAVRGDIDTQWVDNRNAFLELLRGLPEDKQTTFITDLIEAYESGRPPKGYSAVRTFEPGSGTQAGEQMTFRGALRDPVIDLEIEESTSEVVQNKKHGFQMGALADLIYSTLHSMGERRYDPKLKENVAGRNTSNLWDRMADAKLLADTKGDYETLFSASRNLKVKQQRSEMEAIMRKHPAAQLLPDFEDNLSSELDRYTQLRSPEGLKEGPNTHYSIGKLIKNGKKKDGTKYNSVDDVINGDLDRKHDAHIEANPEQQPSQAQPQPSGQPIDQQPTTEA